MASLYGGIIPGFHSPAHELAFYTARNRWLAAGGPLRCSATAKHGGKCNTIALRGYKYCRWHVASSVRRARALQQLRHPATAKQAARTVRREHARLQRIAWKNDRWCQGRTVTLGDREDAFEADVWARGFSPADWSAATLDAARWAWLGFKSNRLTSEQLTTRIRWHIGKDMDAIGL
jgi:hypothetical protein